MNEISQGLAQAFWLVISLDKELITISLRSLYVTLTALLISTLIAFPLAALIVVIRFRFRRLVITVLNALMGLPPVVVGLVVYIVFSRSGPLGVLGLLYTTSAMIIAQTIIITPLVTSIAHQSMKELWTDYRDLLISINTSKPQRVRTLMWDSRRALITACLAGFGRGIGEVLSLIHI